MVIKEQETTPIIISRYQGLTPIEHNAMASSVEMGTGNNRRVINSGNILTFPKPEVLTPVALLDNNSLEFRREVIRARIQHPLIEYPLIMESEPKDLKGILWLPPMKPNSKHTLDLFYLEVLKKRNNKFASDEEVLRYFDEARLDPDSEKIFSLELARVAEPLNKHIIIVRVLPDVHYLEAA